MASPSPSASFSFGAWLLVAASVLGCADAIINFFWTGNGIHGTEGAAMVIFTSTLLVLGAMLLTVRGLWGWLRVVVDVLVVIDLLGTGFAAYLLEAWILLGLMAVGLIGWLIHIFAPTIARPMETV